MAIASVHLMTSTRRRAVVVTETEVTETEMVTATETEFVTETEAFTETEVVTATETESGAPTEFITETEVVTATETEEPPTEVVTATEAEPGLLWAVTTDPAQIDADLTDYPLHISLALMPSSFWDVVTSNGGDIRAYADSSMSEELAVDVVFVNTTTDTGIIFVKVPTLSSTVPTVIYIAADGISTMPAASSTYGRHAVWADYDVVWWHQGGNINRVDDVAWTAQDTPPGTDGTTGWAEFTLLTEPIFWSGRDTGDVWTIAARGEANQVTDANDIFVAINETSGDGDRIALAVRGNPSDFAIWNNTDSWLGGGTPVANTPNIYHAGHDGTTQRKIRVDGGTTFSAVDNSIASRGGQYFVVGGPTHATTSGRLAGSIQFAYKRMEYLSDDWIDTEYRNYLNVGPFLTIDEVGQEGTDWVTVEWLVVGGGGAGLAGGGGGGGVRTSDDEGSILLDPTKSYAVVVGEGGDATYVENGGDSSFRGILAEGGGSGDGSPGGSGGGGAGSIAEPGGAGTPGQGNDGGDGDFDTAHASGGGGGSETAGANGVASGLTGTGGDGGNGRSISISGTPTRYGGGGGGSASTTGGSGGLGGGGEGADGSTDNGTPGTDGLGGGGGGRQGTPYDGGDGVVIVRYPGPQLWDGGTVTTDGGDVIHTFTADGSLEPLT